MPSIVRVPPEYRQRIRKASREFGVPANLLALVISAESSWNPSAVGDGGSSIGLAQIHLPAHPYISKAQAADPDFAIRWTARRLGAVWARTRGNAVATVLYHNSPVAASHYVRTGSFGPTKGLARAAEGYLNHVLGPLGGMKGLARMAGFEVGAPEVDEVTTPVEGEEGEEGMEAEPFDPVDEFLDAAAEAIPRQQIEGPEGPDDEEPF
jgi:hypothetical protein